jgi:arylsulfatase A-like enzyme
VNVLLLVIDSLRAKSLASSGNADATLPRTPFLDRLARSSLRFTRAYATECWTLPTHCSIFTGLLPSEHGAHFQTMGYAGHHATAAEVLSSAGYHTEIVTRNHVFEGSMPGITRGFRANTPVFSDRSGLNPLSLMLAMTKPRFRRQILTSGFFHPLQRKSRDFVRSFARATVPADREALGYLLGAMRRCRAARTPFFFFCNLYDVHAPYPPTERSIFRPLRDPSTWHETMLMPFVLPKLGAHAYLRDDFTISDTARRMLLERYHSSIELADARLGEFYAAAEADGVLDDTLVIVAADHGEAFGEHGVYLHDASVHEENVHVPLMIQHPDRAPEVIHDVVSTRDLFGVMCGTAARRDGRGTILDPAYRAAHPIAVAEHFHYAAVDHALPRHRQNLVAAISQDHKVIVRGDEVEIYDTSRDPDERTPERGTIDDFGVLCRDERLQATASAAAVAHLQEFQAHRSRLVGLAA